VSRVELEIVRVIAKRSPHPSASASVTHPDANVNGPVLVFAVKPDQGPRLWQGDVQPHPLPAALNHLPAVAGRADLATWFGPVRSSAARIGVRIGRRPCSCPDWSE
jgi:hypothetical protein